MNQNTNTMKPKILIVDDLPENLLALEKLLEDFDVEFVRALSGNEGLIKALKDDFALAIIDVQMPGMDGFEMVSILHESRKTRHIPVIFVSAIYRKTDHIVRGIESGAIDFISKPINDDVLRGKVKIFIEMYHQRIERENLIKQLELTRERLEVEKAKAENATRAKSMFLASMSHEIRTPLNGIIGMIEILKNTHSREKYEEYLEIIEISADNLLNIINDILDFSKIESDQIELEEIPFNIRDEVNNVVKLLHLKASSKGLDFSAKIAKDVPESLIGDPVRFRQILINLVNNAIKFTDSGFVKIHFEAREIYADKVVFYCSITDSGIGISDQGKERLFLEFSQSERSTTRKYGGSGLGLAISKKLTELMDGEIGVESEEGKGSKFWFTFQMKISPEEVKLSQKKPKVSQSPSQSLNILLVDDNAINRKVALFTLQKLGHVVESVENGKEAVDAFRNGNFDVILMDIQMPVMDGYQATAEIRDLQNSGHFPNSKIVAMTANAEKGEMEKCLELGMDDYISKPFKSESLEEVVQRVML
jgi:two-component system, sensor histidine kinase